MSQYEALCKAYGLALNRLGASATDDILRPFVHRSFLPIPLPCDVNVALIGSATRALLSASENSAQFELALGL